MNSSSVTRLQADDFDGSKHSLPAPDPPLTRKTSVGYLEPDGKLLALLDVYTWHWHSPAHPTNGARASRPLSSVLDRTSLLRGWDACLECELELGA